MFGVFENVKLPMSGLLTESGSGNCLGLCSSGGCYSPQNRRELKYSKSRVLESRGSSRGQGRKVGVKVG